MKITKRQLRRIIREAHFGRFTGRAAPLDTPMRDSGPIPKDQLRKLADIFIDDMGMSPQEVLDKPEFIEQGITDLQQLRTIVKEAKAKILNEAPTPYEREEALEFLRQDTGQRHTAMGATAKTDELFDA